MTQTYTDDELNRLETATETGSWSQSYGYDRHGNRWVDLGAQYGSLPALTPTLSTDVDSARNRLVDAVYDASEELKKAEIL